MNTATSEQSAAASEELASQAELLKNSVNRFKLAQYSTLQNVPGLSPELIKMLEDMADKKTNKQGAFAEDKHPGSSLRPRFKISLDDNNFGKY